MFEEIPKPNPFGRDLRVLCTTHDDDNAIDGVYEYGADDDRCGDADAGDYDDDDDDAADAAYAD